MISLQDKEQEPAEAPLETYSVGSKTAEEMSSVSLAEIVIVPSNRSTVSVEFNDVSGGMATARLSVVSSIVVQRMGGFWDRFPGGPRFGLYFLTSAVLVALVASMLTWHRLEWVFGIKGQGFPQRMGPTRKAVLAHGLSTSHDLMGASSLTLGLPLVYITTLYLHHDSVTNPHAGVGVAFGLAAYQAWISIWSYLGDYYFWLVDEHLPKLGTTNDTDEIQWWQKAWIMVSVDGVFAMANVVLLNSIAIVQMFYSATPISLAQWALIGAIFGFGFGSKIYGGWVWDEYSKDLCGDTMWWGIFFHTMWHIGGCTLSMIQIYFLMHNGLRFEALTKSEEEIILNVL